MPWRCDLGPAHSGDPHGKPADARLTPIESKFVDSELIRCNNPEILVSLAVPP